MIEDFVLLTLKKEKSYLSFILVLPFLLFFREALAFLRMQHDFSKLLVQLAKAPENAPKNNPNWTAKK